MEWDAETGLYHDRGLSGENPFYDPQTGRACARRKAQIVYLGGHNYTPDVSGTRVAPRNIQPYRLRVSHPGNNPWSGGGGAGGSPSGMQKGAVKFFNEAKSFGRVAGGGPLRTLTNVQKSKHDAAMAAIQNTR